jgi:hypothetical protein
MIPQSLPSFPSRVQTAGGFAETGPAAVGLGQRSEANALCGSAIGPRRGATWRGALCSALLHSAFLIGLAFLGIDASYGHASLVLQSKFDAEDKDVALSMSASESAAPPAVSLRDEPNTPVRLPPLPRLAVESLVVEPASVGMEEGFAAGQGRAAADKEEIQPAASTDRQARRGLADGSGTQFFGVDALGEKFVFIIDSSTSMEGPRWRAAVRELVRCVGSLNSDQRYYVICFDYRTHLMFDHRPDTIEYSASDPNSMKRFKRWLGSVRMGRATKPMEAVAIALRLHPDAIFLLSDGEFQDQTREFLLGENGIRDPSEQIPIHTIGLMSDVGWGTLRTIAAENGGTFEQVGPGGD